MTADYKLYTEVLQSLSIYTSFITSHKHYDWSKVSVSADVCLNSCTFKIENVIWIVTKFLDGVSDILRPDRRSINSLSAEAI